MLIKKAQLLTVLSLVFIYALPAHAVTKQESAVVINLAGKQRMLTQKMSKESLLIAKGIESGANVENLKKTTALFDKTLNGLINGDAELGLPKTENAEILAQLDKVSALWANFKKSIDAASGGDTGAAVLDSIAKENVPLLKNMNAAVQMYAKASGSTLDPAMATTINLAGKQRMLTQRMTKELLLVANGIDADGNKASLGKTVALFDRTLMGLFDGENELGLSGTKDAAIRDQLAVVQKLWGDYKPVLDAVDISADGLAKAAKLNLPLLKNMNKAVKMYEASVK